MPYQQVFELQETGQIHGSQIVDQSINLGLKAIPGSLTGDLFPTALSAPVTIFTLDRLLLGLGSAASPSLSFGVDQDTGIYRQASDALGFATGGSLQWYINSAGQFIYNTGAALVASTDNSLSLRAVDGTVWIEAMASDASAENVVIAADDGGGVWRQRIVVDGDGATIFNNDSGVEVARMDNAELRVHQTTNPQVSIGSNADQPRLHIDSQSAGDNWTAQGAYISMGESAGSANNTALQLSYTGDGRGRIGMGSMEGVGNEGEPDNAFIEFIWNTDEIRHYIALTERARLSATFFGAVAGHTSNFGMIRVGGTPSATAPTFTFTNDQDTGIYLDAVNEIGITTGGIRRINVRAAGTSFADSTAQATGDADIRHAPSVSNPAYSFWGDSDTGMRRGGANDLRLTVGGVDELIVTAGQIDMQANVLVDVNEIVADVGSASDPSYTFDGDTNTGMYAIANTRLGLSMNGIEYLGLTSSVFDAPNVYNNIGTGGTVEVTSTGIVLRNTSLEDWKQEISAWVPDGSVWDLLGIEYYGTTGNIKDDPATWKRSRPAKFLHFGARQALSVNRKFVTTDKQAIDDKAVLTALVVESKARFEAAEAKIDALESRIAILETA